MGPGPVHTAVPHTRLRHGRLDKRFFTRGKTQSWASWKSPKPSYEIWLAKEVGGTCEESGHSLVDKTWADEHPRISIRRQNESPLAVLNTRQNAARWRWFIMNKDLKKRHRGGAADLQTSHTHTERESERRTTHKHTQQRETVRPSRRIWKMWPEPEPPNHPTHA